MKKLLFFVLFLITKAALSQDFNIQDGMLMQTFSMYYEDEFVYTKPYVYKNYPDFYAGEANPIANYCFERNLWVPYYIGGSLITYGIEKNIPSVISTPINILITIQEIVCIHSWHINGFGPPEVSWNFFTDYF